MLIDRTLYKEKIIIFIDILNIRNFTTTSDDNQLIGLYEKINNLVEIFDIRDFSFDNPEITLKNEKKVELDLKFNINKEILDFSISSLSDTIIISFSSEYLFMLPDILRLPRNLQLFLFAHYGLICRGVATKGLIYQTATENVIFGKGLVDAATKEKNAQIPAVIIDEDLIDEYLESITDKSIKQTMLELQKDGILSGEEIDLFIKIIQSKPQEGIIKCYYYLDQFHDCRHVFQRHIQVLPPYSDIKTMCDFHIKNNIQCLSVSLSNENDDLKKEKMQRNIRYWNFIKSEFKREYNKQ